MPDNGEVARFQALSRLGNAPNGGNKLVMATGEVRLETVTPRKLAAVRREVAIRDIARAFKPALDQTPAGQAAVALHTGSYASLVTTHDAIHAWCKAQNRVIADASWELYGDWTDDESKLETTVFYLLT